MSAVSAGDQGLGKSERGILLLVGAVQFVNVLDFMIVMPLGPDFAEALGISLSQLGLVGGSYTASAAIAGLLGSSFLDRFDRRSALAFAMFGLVLGTLAAGFAWDLPSLIAARVIAGAFGGPATSLSLSVIADVVPPERRGRALGIVMGGFAVASVLGVPLSLELARLGGWRLPFFAVAALGLLVAGGAILKMPLMRAHLGNQFAPVRLSTFLREPSVILSLLATFTVMMAGFSIVPNWSAYLQHNRGYPREHLGMLYLVGGSVSYVAMRAVGVYVDKLGAAIIAALGTALFVLALAGTFVYELSFVPVILSFTAFMTSMALRNVSLNALCSRVPLAHERARFMSIQSAVQHIAAALGALSSSALLREEADHRLAGMDRVAVVAIALGLLLPVALGMIERRLARRAAPAVPAWSTESEVARASLPPA